MLRNKFVSYVFPGIAALTMLFWIAVPVASFGKGEVAAAKKQPQKEAAPFVPQEEYVYDVGGKRDPFIPLITADGRFVQLERTKEEAEAEVLKLEGIIFDKYGLSYAIVDGSVVKVGDIIADYQVLRIEEKKVVFIREGQIKEILLQKED